ncbi:RNA ligase and tail fiber protein attachment catalyst [Streptomyces phage NootNoot]|uniref:RNA ligase n=1 Tax=Streptomyces phage NootNoot TaxID=2023992 RepID=A0A222Z0X9_9CAUD|nr:RNA ligase and tail fiber protein attachment catalyst [Streptomyces phage NootNoot]UGL63155.1 RNA ligase [Streptomyces phage Bartholomune]UOW93589.1 RNA ligase [Streptomyces phage Squillium]WNM73418.1 RNA ligase [Streptomyces phage Liandry]WNM74819.1 RNA ligase [Streptomyces phage PinkiePie]ASR77416.1 RNA ligase [Streptomyces phage NootNoot]
MKFTKIFSQDLLDQMVNEGFVRVQTHPVLPLRILNYSEKAQFAGRWNACTLACRGLIIDQDDNVIARPFEKFFNMGDSHAADIDWDAPVEVTDKKDGSMGILYSIRPYNPDMPPYGHEYSFATRGSFASDQAIHATKLWLERYKNTAVPHDWTFIFEIVYPDNRIVLDYGDMDDLILLGAVNKEHGYVYGPREAAALLDWQGPVTEVFDYKNIHDAVGAPYRSNAEGLVIRSGKKMVKLKQADYIELHRLISMLSERSVWSQLTEGKTILEICEALPDEFHQFVKDVGGKLLSDFERIEIEVRGIFHNLLSSMDEGFTRRDFAMKANGVDHYRSHMFNLLDGKDISELIWKQLKPAAKSEDGYPQ